MIERARMVASAIDGTLDEALGFSLSDICELVLRRVDSAATVLALAWGADRADAPGAAATLTEAELAAARTIPQVADIVAACSNRERAAAALDWATTETLKYHPSTATATFGSDLESNTLAPTLFAMLAESISQLNAAALLDVAVTELEYANCDAYMKGRKRAWNRRFPVIGYDPIARTIEERESDVKLTKAIRLIVEEIVHNPPKGSRARDRIDWRRLLALADLCSEAVLRSEQNHYGLTPVATTISEQYEITQKATGAPLIDIRAFHRAQARETSGRS
jgi:hypothetical protein